MEISTFIRDAEGQIYWKLLWSGNYYTVQAHARHSVCLHPQAVWMDYSPSRVLEFLYVLEDISTSCPKNFICLENWVPRQLISSAVATLEVVLGVVAPSCESYPTTEEAIWEVKPLQWATQALRTTNLHRPSLEAQEGNGSLVLDLAPVDPLHLRLNKLASGKLLA